MLKQDMEHIVTKFYDSLEEGKILARKCPECGHIEYPPYLACNACGALDMEWVELPGAAQVTQVLPPAMAFSEPTLNAQVGGPWCAAEIVVEGGDPLGVVLVGVTPGQCEQIQDKLPLDVKPKIFQDDGYKVVFWELADVSILEGGSAAEGSAEAPSGALSKIEQEVIAAAAEAYGVDAASIGLSTDVREELSNQSMKMVMFISGIEDSLDVTIDLRDASKLTTIKDFVDQVVALS